MPTGVMATNTATPLAGKVVNAEFNLISPNVSFDLWFYITFNKIDRIECDFNEAKVISPFLI